MELTCAHGEAIADLVTPALLLSLPKLQANIDVMAKRLARHGVNLRPHMKTAKSVDIARLATSGQFGGITVSTIEEAEAFAAAGFKDILYAVAAVPSKLTRLAPLVRSGANICLVIDSVDAARANAAKAAELTVRFGVMVEIDSDGHRSGVGPDSDSLLHIGQAVAETEWLYVAGVMTHAGASYNCRSTDEIEAMAEVERTAVARSAARLRDAGIDIRDVSVGSTPTATFAQSFEGVTEVRVGVYMFQDLVMAGLGVCRIEDLALSVLTTVIGHKSDGSRVIVDAGWMAMSRDRGTANQAVDQSYGVVCSRNGDTMSEFVLASVNQEHGLIARRDGGLVDPAQFPIGSQLRILPNHACATAAAHSGYHLVDEASDIKGFWHRERAR